MYREESRPRIRARVAAFLAMLLGGSLGVLPWLLVCAHLNAWLPALAMLLAVALLYQARIPPGSRPPEWLRPAVAVAATWFNLTSASLFLLGIFGLGMGLHWLVSWGLGFASLELPFSRRAAGLWPSVFCALWLLPASAALGARQVLQVLFPPVSSRRFTWRLLRSKVENVMWVLSAVGLMFSIWYVRRFQDGDASLGEGLLLTLGFLFASFPGPELVRELVAKSRETTAELAPEGEGRPRASAPADGESRTRELPLLAAAEQARKDEEAVSRLFERAGFEVEVPESTSRLTASIDFVARRDTLTVPVAVESTDHAASFDAPLAASSLSMADRIWAASTESTYSQPLLVVVTRGQRQPTLQLGSVTMVGVDAAEMYQALETRDDDRQRSAELLHLSVAGPAPSSDATAGKAPEEVP